MSFFRYYCNRYEKNTAVLYKVVLVLCTIALSIPVYGRYDIKYVTGGCAKDALIMLMANFVFPLLALVSSFSFIRLSLNDNNQNVILRYKSKKRIWIYQSVAGFVFALESVFIIYATAILFGGTFFGVYDVWQTQGSQFYLEAERYNLPLELGMSEFEVYLLIIAVKTIILWIINNIGLLTEYITNDARVAILVIITLCALDYLVYGGVKGMFDIVLLDLYSVPVCVGKLCFALLSAVVLFFGGVYISKFRQYYKKEK